MRISMNGKLKRQRRLFAGLVLTSLLCGCSSMLVDGLELQYTVAYPMRSPEYILRDLGGNRYLLAQWYSPVNANMVHRVRYYDRNTGVLSHLPEAVTVFQEDLRGKPVAPVRYESDSPLQMVFFTERIPGHDLYCAQEGVSAYAPLALCGYLDIVLSTDGGRSFGWRRLKIPTVIGRTTRNVNKYEFVLIRNNTVYLGIQSENHDDVKCYGNASVYAYRSPINGTVVAGCENSFSVLAMPLPGRGDQPLPAQQIPKTLSAELLRGEALRAFDPGPPPGLLVPPPAAPAAPPLIYTRTRKAQYIESLRAQYPEWAAHQDLEGVPRREQTMSSKELRALRQKMAEPDDDPVDWIKFETPAPRR